MRSYLSLHKVKRESNVVILKYYCGFKNYKVLTTRIKLSKPLPVWEYGLHVRTRFKRFIKKLKELNHPDVGKIIREAYRLARKINRTRRKSTSLFVLNFYAFVNNSRKLYDDDYFEYYISKNYVILYPVQHDSAFTIFVRVHDIDNNFDEVIDFILALVPVSDRVKVLRNLIKCLKEHPSTDLSVLENVDVIDVLL